jgi:hypothetical protein
VSSGLFKLNATGSGTWQKDKNATDYTDLMDNFYFFLQYFFVGGDNLE